MPTRVPTPCAQPASASAGRAPVDGRCTGRCRSGAGQAGRWTDSGRTGRWAPERRRGGRRAGSRGVALGADVDCRASGTRYAPAVPAAPISRTRDDRRDEQPAGRALGPGVRGASGGLGDPDRVGVAEDPGDPPPGRRLDRHDGRLPSRSGLRRSGGTGLGSRRSGCSAAGSVCWRRLARRAVRRLRSARLGSASAGVGVAAAGLRRPPTRSPAWRRFVGRLPVRRLGGGSGSAGASGSARCSSGSAGPRRSSRAARRGAAPADVVAARAPSPVPPPPAPPPGRHYPARPRSGGSGDQRLRCGNAALRLPLPRLWRHLRGQPPDVARPPRRRTARRATPTRSSCCPLSP